jgi:hypothetical protein
MFLFTHPYFISTMLNSKYYVNFQMKKSLKKKGAGAAVSLLEPSSSVTEIPLDGAIYMLIMGACCSLALGKFDVALQVLASAE